MSTPSLSGPEFDRAFPFALSVDASGVTIHVGPSLARLLPELRVGAELSAHFAIHRPLAESILDVSGDPRTLVLLRHHRLNFTLRGEVLVRADRGRLFLGAPWFTDVEDLRQLGLSVREFAAHDPSIDALFLVQAQRRAAEETRELADNLRAMSNEANLARDAAQAMLAAISHRLRTPAHALLGQLSKAHEARSLGEASTSIQASISAARRLERLVARVLLVTELQQAAANHPTPLDPWAEVCTAAAAVIPEHARHLVMLPFAPANAPWALLDPRLLSALVAELVENAVTHGGGPVRVAVELSDAPTSVSIVVEDRGRGAPPHVHDGDFASFPGRDSGQRGSDGEDALGLALVKAATRAMGGEVCVTSPPEGGTRVGVILPTSLQPRSLEDRAASAAPLRVLVVDDAVENRRVAAWALERRGHIVSTAEDGDQALSMVAAGRWDVVLMDVELPTIDGIAAARRILTYPDPRPVVVPFTAYDLAAFRTRCREAGMTGFLVKPAAPDEIAAAVETAVRIPAPAHGGTVPQARVQPDVLGFPPWLLSAFADDLLDTAAALAQADEPESARHIAHRLGGSAGSYGYRGLSEDAQELSRLLRTGKRWKPQRDRVVDTARLVAGRIPRIAHDGTGESLG